MTDDIENAITHFIDCIMYAESNGNHWVFTEVRHLKTAVELLERMVRET